MPPIGIEPNSKVQNIGNQAFVFEDISAKITIREITSPEYQAKFSLSKLQVPNFQTTASAIWVRLQLRVPKEGSYFLEVSYPLLHELDFYAIDSKGQIKRVKSGSALPFDQRKLVSNHFYFELSPDSPTYYLRATAYETLQIPLKVGKIEDFFEQNQFIQLLNGIYFGFVLLIILYNFFLYVSTKEKVYLSYILYVMAVGLVTSNLLGYNFQFFYPKMPFLSFYTPIFYPLNFFVLIFSMDFLSIKDKAPQYRKGFIWLIYACLAEILFNLVGFPRQMFQISQVVGLLVVIYILFVAGKLYLKGYRPAQFFLLAFTMFLLGIVITILLASGAIPYSVFAYHSIQIGSAVEIVLLSFAIADKINIYKKEKEAAQLLALQKAEENQRIIATQKEELEIKVKERTQKIEKQKEEIQVQANELETQNDKLVEYQTIINQINQNLQAANLQLEDQVKERTLALTKANNELVKQNHQLEEYAFVTSHHLRAPVARLLGLASIFDKSKVIDEFNWGIITKIQSETNDLDQIIRDLNQVLAIQKGEDVSYELVNLERQMEITLKRVEKEIQNSEAVIDIDFADVKEIYSIEAYIQNILYNLLANAIKFRYKSRKLIVEIRAWRRQEDNTIVISFKDNGLGIDMNYAKNKIFNLYQRFHAEIEGKGIGLYLVRNQIETQNGNIEVLSEENLGSTFYVSLPQTEGIR